MRGVTATIRTEEVTRFGESLKTTFVHLIDKEAKQVVRELVDFARDKMKLYCKPRTFRSTGRLKMSIRSSRVFKEKEGYKGFAYVPPNIKYAIASEFGFRIRKEKAIKAKRKKYMKFHFTEWINAPVDVIEKFADKRGYFFFRRVSRGTYEGLHFTEKAYNDTVVEANKKAENFGNKLEVLFLAV